MLYLHVKVSFRKDPVNKLSFRQNQRQVRRLQLVWRNVWETKGEDDQSGSLSRCYLWLGLRSSWDNAWVSWTCRSSLWQAGRSWRSSSGSWSCRRPRLHRRHTQINGSNVWTSALLTCVAKDEKHAALRTSEISFYRWKWTCVYDLFKHEKTMNAATNACVFFIVFLAAWRKYPG